NGHAAKDVAAPGHDADPDAKLARLADLSGDTVDHLLIDTERLVAEERLAGDLEQDLLEAKRRLLHPSRLVPFVTAEPPDTRLPRACHPRNGSGFRLVGACRSGDFRGE